MMTGTIDERPPMKANRLSSAPNAEIADLPVFLPIAISVVISVKPNVKARIT